MKRFSILLLPLLLTGCASFFTPKTCTELLNGAETIEALTNVLIERGIEAERARMVANLVRQGSVGVLAVCSTQPEEINSIPIESENSPAVQTISEVIAK